MNSAVKLSAPIAVSGEDFEHGVFDHAKDELDATRAAGLPPGAASQLAATELNRALDVDAFEVLARGWAKVPAVRNAVQLSALVQGPPAIINLDRHNIVFNSRVVLDARIGQSAVPPLTLTLEIAAGVQSATLAARDGRIELIALGKASVVARLNYKGVLVKEHATSVEGARRDPFKRQPSSGVDIYV